MNDSKPAAWQKYQSVTPEASVCCGERAWEGPAGAVGGVTDNKKLLRSTQRNFKLLTKWQNNRPVVHLEQPTGRPVYIFFSFPFVFSKRTWYQWWSFIRFKSSDHEKVTRSQQHHEQEQQHNYHLKYSVISSHPSLHIAMVSRVGWPRNIRCCGSISGWSSQLSSLW